MTMPTFKTQYVSASRLTINGSPLFGLFIGLLIALCAIVLTSLNAHAAGEELLTDNAVLSSLLTDSASTQSQEDTDSSDNNSDDSNGSITTDDADTTIGSNAPVAGNLTQKDTVIATKPDQINDSDIRQRIVGIFSEIEGLQAIVVKVNQGVVSLSGEAPNEKKAQQAINLANRVSDVVAVEDRISRTLDVQDNITPVVDSLKQQTQGLIKAAPLLLVAILVFSLVAWFGGWISKRETLWQRITPNPFVAELLAQTIKVVFIVFGLILALSLIGAEAIIGTLLGGAGVVGIAVGFAVKDTIENYIASLMLSVRQPFRARDHVKINDKDGIVVRLTSRATILMTLDGNRLRIPNSEVFKGIILNYTRNPDRRFDFMLGVDANDDPLAAIKVGVDAINKLDFILKDPKTIAIIDEVGDSNIVLQFQAWVDQSKTDLFKARSIAIREAKHALENTGFSLPEPIYKLRFDGDLENAIKHVPASTVDRLSKQSRIESQSSTTAPDSPHSDATTTAATIDIKTSNTGAANANSNESNASDNSITSATSDNSVPTQRSDNVTQVQASASNNSDAKDKIEAKKRAKQVLSGTDAEDLLDAKPDRKLMQKIEEEIQDHDGDTDLLSQSSPEE